MTYKSLLCMAFCLYACGLCALGDDFAEFKKEYQGAGYGEKLQILGKIQPDDKNALKKAAVFLCDPHPKIRQNAINWLAQEKTDAATAEFLVSELIRKKDLPDYARCSGISALGAISAAPQKSVLIELLNDKNHLLRAEAVKTLSASYTGEDVLGGIRAKLSDPAWQVKTAAIDAVKELAPAELDAKAEELFKATDFQVRIAILESCKETSIQITLLKAAFQDPAWQVRACAIELAAQTGTGPCVEMLVNAFLTAEGRLKADLFAALQKATGKDIGFSPKLWKEWWDIFNKRFEPLKQRRNDNPLLPISETSAFCGIPVLSRNIIFVFDLSGSMRSETQKNGPVKIDTAREEMSKVIKSFTKEVKFNIILLGSDSRGNYNKKEKMFEERLISAADAGKEKAIKFINRQEPNGWTNLYDAVMLCFEDKDVDTIYLLSDGVPSRGVFVARTDIIESIKRENRFRKICIHTIKIGSGARGEKLMRELAEITGGTFTAK
ncbi:MAG: VWA domain-containing protein [Planctomycetes bacterium]|nr:VWA domain-containing protein [Planctomycetota bacterium]